MASSEHLNGDLDPNEKKKLILCFDGTGNTFSGSNADTNVVKILRKLDRNHPNQFHYYQTGIGTYEVNETSVNKGILGDIKSKASKTIDQGIGTTFDAHVMAGYRFLMRYYETDAKIYMFGFSRGAFTAKFLARMINKVGLLCKGNEELVPFAYLLYQRYLQGEIKDREDAQDKANLPGLKKEDEADSDSEPPAVDTSDANNQTSFVTNGNTGEASTLIPEATGGESMLASNTPIEASRTTKNALSEIKAFSQTFCRKDKVKGSCENQENEDENIKVFFLGIWDCVGSVAVLERKAPIPVAVGGTADHVRHAVAIDERRVKFKPALLAQDIKNDLKKSARHTGETLPKQEDIKEVWFPGNHGDVGGGWPAVAPAKRSLLGRLFRWRSKKQNDEPDPDQLQMSDIPLEWMIREVEACGREEKEAAVHWCHSKDEFKTQIEEVEKRKQASHGTMHDCLSIGRGTAFFKVLFWNTLEWLPFMSRWELNDGKVGNKLQGWEFRRWTPNRGSYRDIPQGAVLHRSLIDRLLEHPDYKPKNNHGDGTYQCLAINEATTIYDGDTPEHLQAVDKQKAKFRIHEKVVVEREKITKKGYYKRVTKRVPDKEDDPRHQTYDFNHYVLDLEKKEAEKKKKKAAKKARKAQRALQ